MSDDVLKIALVADYGPRDLAFIEVQQKIYEEAAARGLKVQVDAVSADAFDSTQTAYLVGDLAKSGEYDAVYHNTAPRFDSKKQTNNSGEGLAHTTLTHANGTATQVVGVFSGNGQDSLNTFSELPLEAQRNVHAVDCPNEGTQFRSRDIYVAPVLDALQNKVALKNALRVPQRDAGSISDEALTNARQVADARLAELRSGIFAAHGDASEGYVTVIAPGGILSDRVEDIAKQHPTHEIDALALKTDNHDKKAGYGDGRWIEAGFATAQLALNAAGNPPRTIIALTKDQNLTDVTLSNHEHILAKTALYEAYIDTNTRILTDDIRTLAFVKDRVTFVGHEVSNGFFEPLNVVDLQHLAPLPDGITPAYVDNYGNIKIGLTKESLIERLQAQSDALGDRKWTFPLKAGERVEIDITINGQTKRAALTQSSFDLEPGEIAISSGSSGWAKTKDAPKGEKHYFAEFFTRGQNTAAKFGAQVGDAVTVTYRGITDGHEPTPEVERSNANNVERSTDLSQHKKIG